MLTTTPSANDGVTKPLAEVTHANWQKLVDTLQTKNYQLVLKYIDDINTNNGENHPHLLILELVRQLCSVGQQYSNEVDAYQNRYQQAIIAERELHASLLKLLTSMAPISKPSLTRLDKANLVNPYPVASHSEIDTQLTFKHHEYSLVVYFFGQFQVYAKEQPILSWSSKKGKTIFKYLLLKRKRHIPKEVLMDVFWPNADPDSARNSLNVAIYGLRKTLRKLFKKSSPILFENDCYQIDPQIKIWLDVDQFDYHFQQGQRMELDGFQEEAMKEYVAADALNQGEFLAEDRYDDWINLTKQKYADDSQQLLGKLSHYYFQKNELTHCIYANQKILTIESCREDVHRMLMHCYAQQGQRYLAIRQYHLCQNSLKIELNLKPSKETEDLYRLLRNE